MSVLAWIQGLSMVAPHLVLLTVVCILIVSVASFFLEEEHVILGMVLSFFTAFVIAMFVLTVDSKSK